MALNKNAESHFALAPMDLSIGRSIFDRSSGHKTTFNTGDLIPIYVDEVLPGDTFTMDMGMAMRMATPIFPVMDNLSLDVQFYFVPNRLVWEHWAEMLGENNTTAWEQPTEYTIPQIEAPADGWTEGTIADYMGLPTKVGGLSVSALPFRAYCKIWNDWWRDENLKQPAMINMDETTVTGVNTGNYVTDAQLGGLPLKAAKWHDYFTSALPEPQKGPATELNIGVTFAGGDVPVYGNGKTLGLTNGITNVGLSTNTHGSIYAATTAYNVTANTNTDSENVMPGMLGVVTNGESGLTVTLPEISGGSFTINELRQAFAIQRMYEKDARGGTRLTEILKVHFGVTSPDARLQRAEYLGGTRVPVNIDQVLQTSSTDATTPQGNTAAYSLTNFAGSMFSHSFVEHGWIIGVAVARTNHTYQQGIERMWSRKNRFDFYWPTLANLGEQAILNKEIYAQGTDEDEAAFGYQEAWAEYRYKTDRVSGLFRSNADGTLDSWHFADDYEALPLLSSTWIDETDVNVDRTIAVPSQPQFIADFYFKCNSSRPMPLYSVPGMIDHH